MTNTTWERLVDHQDLKSIKKFRALPYLVKNIYASSLEDAKNDGWEFLSKIKNSNKIKIKKDKPQNEVFEDDVWLLFYDLGFTTLNRDRHFIMSYGEANGQTQQIDVFAVDEETIILVECKSAITPKDGIFKKEIEALGLKMQGLKNEALKKFPNRKIKFIFATRNYSITAEDRSRMCNSGITHLDELQINYYSSLAKHLGSSARYQLLGDLFATQTIKGMQNLIPAIRGKMGNHTYYSFSIEPEKLLKIGYVLHRNETNNSGLDEIQTYQRLIKKNRLNSIRKFIEAKGYFANSIIISINTKRALRFDLSEKQIKDSISTLGVLHLPQKYKSAYIIDGQHRLYGYSDSKYASTNSIPVVAFENLDEAEQVKLFMDINENQKSVSKNLRNTLNAHMLWFSPKESEKRDALRLRIAQYLGEKNDSPLYNRIIIGEEQSTPHKCITIESIRIAINVGNFLSKFDKKNILTQHGIFDSGKNDITFNHLYKYLELCLLYIKNNVKTEWEKGSSENGFLVINNGIGGLIRVINDIVNLLIKEKNIDPLNSTPENIAKATYYYLDPVCRFIDSISDEERNDIKTTYGGNGPIHCLRYFQKAIHNERKEFYPEGLTKYWEDHGKEYNQETITMLADIERNVKILIRRKLEDSYSSKWINEIPKPIFTKASQEAVKQEYDTGETCDFWDFITILNCKDIITFGKNWSDHFSESFTLDSEKKKTGGKAAKTDWMNMVDKLQKKLVKQILVFLKLTTYY